jgi:nitroimidazol reductase NimA-like FMN-containing flavoprotein (pyridoxamine 5'-phosphate oxidase superfamily)
MTTASLATGTTRKGQGVNMLDSLTREMCLEHLRTETVGRIALLVDNDPIILPVNYRLVETRSGPLLTLRTRPGNVIDQAPSTVAFEIDAIDPIHHQGWSVLVRGELVHATSTSPEFIERYDPASWLTDRASWMFVDPWAISGRELSGSEPIWPVRPGEYL